jgi:hypothetical protein
MNWYDVNEHGQYVLNNVDGNFALREEVEPILNNTGSPKLPPCKTCAAGKFCYVGVEPDTYMCYDAWRQLRASA